MGDEQIRSIATLEAKFEFFTKSFDEFKEETKERDEKFSKKIDELAMEINKFGGFFNALTAQQITINSLSDWRSKITPSIDSITDQQTTIINLSNWKTKVSPLIDSIGKTKTKISDIIWEAVKVGVLFIVGFISAKIFK